MKPSSGRMLGIDVLRGIAVLAVLVRHLPFSSALKPAGGAAGGEAIPALPAWLTAITDYGEYGVHLFLVISGFCIHMRWARRFDLEAKVDFVPFWKRRLHRLYPPYFVTLLLSLLGLYVLFGVLGKTVGPWFAQVGYPSGEQLAIDLVLLLLLAQNLNGAHARIGNAPYWSLALEEQLYILYFPLLHLRRRFGWLPTLALVAAVTVAWRAIGIYAFEKPPSFWYIVGPALWLPWTLGAIAVEVQLGHVKLPAFTRSFAVFAGLVVLGILVDPPAQLGLHLPGARVLDDLVFGAAFFVLVNAVGDLEARGGLGSGRVVMALAAAGLWSYSIYLCHMPALIVAKQIGLRLGLGTPAILALRAVLGVLAGYVFYRLVERHFLNASRPTPKAAPAIAPELRAEGAAGP